MGNRLVTIVTSGGVTSEDLAAIPPLDELQRRVGGGLIQVVPRWDRYGDESCIVLCNEEGKLRGMPVNVEATDCWHRALGRQVDDYLVGPIVLLVGDDAFLSTF